MPTMFDSKLFNPEVFAAYVDRVPRERTNAFLNSGAMTRDQSISSLFVDQVGGNYATIPFTSTSVTQDGTAVYIAVQLDGPLQQETRYCLILAQPVPVLGCNLPVRVVVSFTDGCGPVTVPLKRLHDKCGCGVCNLEFGQDLPKCKNRLQLYYTNGNDFIDLR